MPRRVTIPRVLRRWARWRGRTRPEDFDPALEHARWTRVGDQVVIRGRHVDDAARTATVIAVHGPDGDPPYRVRFGDGHETLFFPGPDAVITSP